MRIKGLFLAGATVAGLPIYAVSAADLPAKMPPKVPLVAPPYSWTGFYVGANVGAVWAHSDVARTDSSVFPFLFANDSHRYSGVIGGVQAGYNLQFSYLVVGVEGDYDFASASNSVLIGTINTHNSRFSSLATVRGRIGVAFDRFLPYFTSGVAFANFKNELIGTSTPLPLRRDGTETTWVIGGGLEYAFTDHLSAKAEYLYVDLRDETLGGLSTPYLFTFKDSASIARAGINYKF